jgi:hypothetical protein
MATQPTLYIDQSTLATVLSEEAAALDATASAWWSEFAVKPFTAAHGDSAHYVVAQQDRHIIFFADDEDEFATGILTEDGEIISYGLVGDLIDAIRNCQERNRTSEVT